MQSQQSYSLPEAAELVGVSARWLADRVRARRVPHYRPGRAVRFTAADVAAIQEQFRVPTATAPTRRRGPFHQKESR